MQLPDFLQPRPFTPVEVIAPCAPALPLVCDSPHSGTAYPADFGHCVPMELLRRGEDTDVHRLWQRWPAHGATLLAATFPRTYIDVNRSADDIDPAQLDSEWPTPLAPGIKTRQGLGLIWQRIVRDGVAPAALPPASYPHGAALPRDTVQFGPDLDDEGLSKLIAAVGPLEGRRVLDLGWGAGAAPDAIFLESVAP